MKINGKKIEKTFSTSKEETFKNCLKALHQLQYTIISSDLEAGALSFKTNFGHFNVSTNGDYLYRCSIVNIGDEYSKCIIWCEECLDQTIPLFEVLFNRSCKYSNKVLELM